MLSEDTEPWRRIDPARLVKIIQLHDSARSVMMEGLDEANQLGTSAGVCNGTGESGIVAPERVSGCAGLNRHGSEDARASRERSSAPLGPEFCTGRCEMSSEA